SRRNTGAYQADLWDSRCAPRDDDALVAIHGASAARAGRRRAGLRDPVLDHQTDEEEGGDVLGKASPARADRARRPPARAPLVWGPPRRDPRFVVLQTSGRVDAERHVWTRLVIHHLESLLAQVERARAD